jgi:hypothetical protein
MKRIFILFAPAVLVACGGNSSSDNSIPPANLTSISGRVIDPPVSGASVFLDLNCNLQLDANEPSSTSTSSGNFTILAPDFSTISADCGMQIVSQGGIDVSDGTSPQTSTLINNKLSSEDANVVLTPLSTVASYLNETQTDLLLQSLSIGESARTVFESDIWTEEIENPSDNLLNAYPFREIAPDLDAFYKNVVYQDPSWDWATVTDFSQVLSDTTAAFSGLLDVAPDFDAYIQAGGKIIMAHGLSDATVPTQLSTDLYESLITRIGLDREASISLLQESIRYYIIPGFGHGGSLQSDGTITGQGQGVNSIEGMLSSLVDWVENNNPPDAITATRLVNDITIFQRPLCKYPEKAVYAQGSTDSIESFSCI